MQISAFWFYTVPNYVLAALMYSLLARFVLGFFLSDDSSNYIFRFFIRITDPVLRAVRFVTPLAITGQVVLLLSMVWLLMVRFGFFLAMAQAGLAPVATA